MKRYWIPLLTAAAITAYAATDFTAEGNRWWSYIEYLASDARQGRGLGTEGFAKASDYVADQFRKAGLKPGGTSGYFQPIPFDVREIVENQSNVSLVRDGKAEAVTLGDDATI